MVPFDLVEVVEVIHHQAGALGEPLGRCVAQSVDALKPRAVAQMKPRDRIDGPIAGRARF